MSADGKKPRATHTGVMLAVVHGGGKPLLRFHTPNRPLSPGHKKLIDILARRAVRELRGDPDPAA